MPNGRSIVLERQPGADTAGYAGLEDGVDNHWLELFKAAALSTLLGVGTELGSSGNDSDIIQALRAGQGIPKPDRATGGSAQPEYSAHPDDPAGVPGPRDRKPRFGARAVQRIETKYVKA